MTLEMKFRETQRETAIEMVTAMFQNGIPFEVIEKCTRLLSTEELKEVQARVQNGEPMKQ